MSRTWFESRRRSDDSKPTPYNVTVMQPASRAQQPTSSRLETSLGARLRQERERRRITLASIAANTKIGAGLLEGLERDDVSRWPSGIFRRSFIRAYAEAIGLDPDETTREFLECFPDCDAAAPSATEVTQQPAPASKPAGSQKLRLTLANHGAPFAGGPILGEVRRRGAAVAWDAGVVFGIGLILFLVVGRFWQPLGISVLCYYMTSIFLLGNTPGVCLFAPADAPSGDDAAAGSLRNGSAQAAPSRSLTEMGDGLRSRRRP
jgi:transcriptional regulator with XRE-family HTH domain